MLKATDKCKGKFQSKRDHALLSLFLATGARLGELVALDVEDIDFEKVNLSEWR